VIPSHKSSLESHEDEADEVHEDEDEDKDGEDDKDDRDNNGSHEVAENQRHHPHPYPHHRSYRSSSLSSSPHASHASSHDGSIYHTWDLARDSLHAMSVRLDYWSDPEIYAHLLQVFTRLDRAGAALAATHSFDVLVCQQRHQDRFETMVFVIRDELRVHRDTT
jgi:hypothetical protein